MRLAYREAGSGRPAVLLHAGYLDRRMRRDQLPYLTLHYRVITADARGHGDSANATRAFRHTDDLAALLRHLGTGPAVLAGVSMGAATAVDTALEHPELVRALVVSGAGTSEPEFTDPWTLDTLGRQLTAMAERLAVSVTHGQSAAIGGAAHFPSMERPDAYRDALAGFLEELPAPAR